MSAAEQNQRLVWKGATAKSTPKPPDTIGRIYIPDRVLGWIIPATVLLVFADSEIALPCGKRMLRPMLVGRLLQSLALQGGRVQLPWLHARPGGHRPLKSWTIPMRLKSIQTSY